MANIENSLFWDVIKWIVGIGGSLLVIGLSVVLWVFRDYFLRFHDTVKVLFQRFRELESERAAKWDHQNDFCRECYAIAKTAIEIIKRREGKDVEKDKD